MTQSPPSLPFFSAPLAAALENIQFQLKRENTARIVVATARMSELQKKNLPSHMQVVGRPLAGRRVAVRSTRNFRRTRLRIAHYPECQMDEVAMPMLLCVVSGLARIYAGDYVLTCRPGDFVLIPPMIPKGDYLSHAVDDDAGSTSDILYIYPGRLLGDGLELWITRSEGKRTESSAQLGAALLRNHFLAPLFSQFCKETQNSPQSEIAFLLTKSLILFLLREILQKRALLPDIKRLHLPTEHDHDPIKYALTYLESNLSTPLTIEGMARETALSATSFKELFRQTTGFSFHRYLTEQRIKFAERLLGETNMSVQEIAKRIGLSPSRLNRHFHARHSCSPGEWRRGK